MKRVILQCSGPFALLLLISLGGTLAGQDVRPAVLRTSLAAWPEARTAVWVFFGPEVWHGPHGEVSGVGPGPSSDSQLPSPAALSLRTTVLATGARIRVESRFLRGLSLSVDSASLEAVSTLTGVLSVRPVGRAESTSPRGSGPGAGVGLPVSPADSTYGGLADAATRLGVHVLHDLGFTGAGVRIGILDGHFRTSVQALQGLDVIATRDFVEEDISVEPRPEDPPEAADHGTALWSLVGGRWPDVLIAPAFGASFLLARTSVGGEAVPRADEDRWVAGLEWLEGLGARIVLSGVSFRSFDDYEYPYEELDGDRAPATRAADEAARRGVLVVAPVGNTGPDVGSLGAPSDGDSVLAVGAADSAGRTTDFSARGPTADGRPRPILLSPGVDLAAAMPSDPDETTTVSGTEFAAALMAGSVALFTEAHPGRSAMEVLNAAYLAASAEGPGSLGVPDMAAAVLFPDGLTASPVEEVDAQGRVTTLTPLFVWDAPSIHPLALPVRFTIELSEDPSFGTITLADTVMGTFARRIPHPLPPEESLYWRITATTTQDVTRRSWVGDALEVPPWVELSVLNEPGGSEISDPQPTFEWQAMEISAPAGPFTFELQVISDRDEEPLATFPDLTEERFTVPDPLPFNETLRWRVVASARDGSADTVTSAGPFVVTSRFRPPKTILYQNFPNPFPRTDLDVEDTRIWFDLAHASEVDLAIYDIRGRLVRRLIPGPGCSSVRLEPGPYGRVGTTPDPCVVLTWDGRDDRGRRVGPGVYLLRLKADGVEEIRRIVFWP